MRLDGRLSHAEFVSYLLVEQSLAQHGEDAQLLGRQRRQARGDIGRATLAVHSSRDRAQLLDASTLEDAARLGFEILLELERDEGA